MPGVWPGVACGSRWARCSCPGLVGQGCPEKLRGEVGEASREAGSCMQKELSTVSLCVSTAGASSVWVNSLFARTCHEKENHRGAGVGWEPQGSLGPNPGSSKGHPKNETLYLRVLSNFKLRQAWCCDRFPVDLVPVPDHPVGEETFSWHQAWTTPVAAPSHFLRSYHWSLWEISCGFAVETSTNLAYSEVIVQA